MDVQCVFWGTEIEFLEHCLTEKECKEEGKAWKEGERKNEIKRNKQIKV